jgi:hypothetical protein
MSCEIIFKLSYHAFFLADWIKRVNQSFYDGYEHTRNVLNLMPHSTAARSMSFKQDISGSIIQRLPVRNY